MDEISISLWGLFISAFISSTLAPGGSEAVLAYMVSTGDYTIEKLIVIATVGNTLGAVTTWVLGSFTAKKFPIERLLEQSKQKSIATVRKWGVWALLFSWLPIVGDGLCFAGGWIKLAFWPACLAIMLGKAIRYAFIAYLFV